MRQNYRYLYDLTLQKITRQISLPSVGEHPVVGSSQGFLFYVNEEDREIHAINALTGANLPLPSTSSLPNFTGVIRESPGGPITHYVRRYSSDDDDKARPRIKTECIHSVCMRKAILSPSLDTEVVLYSIDGGHVFLSFARDGDSSWTAVPSPFTPLRDAIFCKDGNLRAVDHYGTLFLFDLNVVGPFFVSVTNKFPLSYEDDWKELHWERYLVESPDGRSLFLLVRERPTGWETAGFRVFKLVTSRTCKWETVKSIDNIERTCKWEKVKNIGDIALFVGVGDSLSAPAASDGLSHPKPNHIYFTGDCCGRTRSEIGVFSLEDGSVKPLPHGYDDLVHWDQSIWFTPNEPHL